MVPGCYPGRPLPAAELAVLLDYDACASGTATNQRI